MYNLLMKHCKRCKVKKQFNQFHRRGTGYQAWCKLCKKEHDHHTYKTRPHRRKQLKEWTKKYRTEVERFIFQYLQSHSCCSCGETNILTLQFDHLRDKKFNIGERISQGYSIPTLEKEINKCQILCANCHSIKSAAQLNNWKLKWLAQSDSN